MELGVAKRIKKGPKSLWDKVNEVDHEFAVAANTMTDDQLKQSIVELTNNDEMLLKAKESDMDLIRAREELGECNKTYSVPAKTNRLKKQLAIETLQGRGKLVS